MKQPIGAAEPPPELATMDPSLQAAAAAAVPIPEPVPLAHGPGGNTLMAFPGIPAAPAMPPGVHTAGGPMPQTPLPPTMQNTPEAAAGIHFNPAAIAKLKVRRNFAVNRPPRMVTFRTFNVWGKGEWLARVDKAVDESDAIAQVVAALGITNTEQWMFQARVDPSYGETKIPSHQVPASV